MQEYLNKKFAKKKVQDLCQGMFVVDLSRISSVIADTTPRLSASQLRSGETEASSTFTFQISFLNFYFFNFHLTTFICQLSLFNFQLSTFIFQLSFVNFYFSTLYLSTPTFQMSVVNFHLQLSLFNVYFSNFIC